MGALWLFLLLLLRLLSATARKKESKAGLLEQGVVAEARNDHAQRLKARHVGLGDFGYEGLHIFVRPKPQVRNFDPTDAEAEPHRQGL